MESVVPDQNDKTKELGLWMSRKDGQENLKHRKRLQAIIKELRVFWEKTQ